MVKIRVKKEFSILLNIAEGWLGIVVNLYLGSHFYFFNQIISKYGGIRYARITAETKLPHTGSVKARLRCAPFRKLLDTKKTRWY